MPTTHKCICYICSPFLFRDFFRGKDTAKQLQLGRKAFSSVRKIIILLYIKGAVASESSN